MVVQGLGGIMSITGYPGEPPARVGMSIGDIGAGLYTAIAVNAALLHRERSGEATKVDIGMLDCQIALLENAVMRYTVLGEIPGPLGARHPTITPFQAFATDDGNIIIAAGNDGLFQKLCAALGRKDLAESPLYRSNDLRLQNQPRLQDELERTLKEQADRAMDRRARGGRHSLRPDQQRRAGAGASAGRRAQHADHGRGRGRRHACASPATRSNSRPLPIRPRATPPPISTPTARRSSRSWARHSARRPDSTEIRRPV